MKVRPQIMWSDDAASQLETAVTLREAVCGRVVRGCLELFGDAVEGLILTGSLARDEATWVKDPQGWRVLGDAEFLLVFRSNRSLPVSPQVEQLARRIGSTLEGSGVRCSILLSACHPAYLQQLKPHIFAYELKTCGQVVYGDETISSNIPSFSWREIPLEDAWWLLCNRMVEHLSLAAALKCQGKELPAELAYQTTKLFLDMGTSFLLFDRNYAPTYRERARILSELALDPRPNCESPVPLRSFAERVRACTSWKANLGDPKADPVADGIATLGWSVWQEAIAWAHQIWRWELEQLTGARSEHLDPQLLLEWARRQPVHRRLHGWLYVLRRRGWHRSWRSWPRWFAAMSTVSPRYGIYLVASELFFQLPLLLSGEHDGEAPLQSDWASQELRSWLPVEPPSNSLSTVKGWRELSAEVYWNYHEFAMDTRA